MNPSLSPGRAALLGTCACLLFTFHAQADVRLPAIVSDNMVLLQDTPANVWGWADPQEKVSVQFSGKTAEATADADGKWSVKLEVLQPSATGDLVVAGKNTLTVKNVAVGEVWVCSGQSNMEWVVANSKNAQQEISSANFPNIRMFTVQKNPKATPQTDCQGKWEVCSPETVGRFSAVGYFFGRNIHESVKVPIGLIHTSWGGTPAEFWTPRDVLAGDPDFQNIIQSWETVKANYPKAKADYDKALEAWNAASEKAKAEGKPAPRRPSEPRGANDFGSPGCLYNGMVAPILPYTIRGTIWYQGESNAGNAQQYQKLFPTMITSWRQRWGVGEFPFLFVQLANYNARNVPPTGQPEDSNWAALREAQTMTLDLPHTGMAVAIDIGEATDIHPKNKQEVGRRLGLVAQATVYYREVEFSGPMFAGVQEEDGKLRLSFRHAEGLKAADGGKIKGFAIAGEDRKFVWADAELQGDHIVLQSAQVPKPVAVRYGWADNPDCNLVNASGLPASPFRSDDWPQRPGATAQR